jgi:pimeloyl-ACP methyl ester carboxylesterase
MDASKAPERIDRDRRRLLGTATMGIAVAGATSLLPAHWVAASPDDAIRPFRIDVPDEQLTDLRRRVVATRWPDKETVTDRSQGVQLLKLQALVGYWGTAYDWRKTEAKLNALPQFTTTIDDVEIHFIHVRSGHPGAMPLIITHGWPGSVLELLKTVGPLTDPAAHGGLAEDAFHLVMPSIPGYGFSGKPTGTGWDPDRVARTWAELMKRLGYTSYVAQGGDWGAPISSAMARQAPTGLIGIHINLPATAPPEVAAALAEGGPAPAGLSEKERTAFESLDMFTKKYRAYSVMMATRPQTIGYALLDSPVALAAWMLDHDTDSYYKISRAFVDGQPSGGLTRDHVLDNITLYWLTGTGASAARSYWENTQAAARAAGQPRPDIKLPVGFTTFPGEIWRTPRSWAEKSYPSLSYFHEASKGGHFAAWEEPELFAAELRAAFASLR